MNYTKITMGTNSWLGKIDTTSMTTLTCNNMTYPIFRCSLDRSFTDFWTNMFRLNCVGGFSFSVGPPCLSEKHSWSLVHAHGDDETSVISWASMLRWHDLSGLFNLQCSKTPSRNVNFYRQRVSPSHLFRASGIFGTFKHSIYWPCYISNTSSI